MASGIRAVVGGGKPASCPVSFTSDFGMNGSPFVYLGNRGSQVNGSSDCALQSPKTQERVLESHVWREAEQKGLLEWGWRGE